MKITNIVWHRNGSGHLNGFHSVEFTGTEGAENGRKFVATVFENSDCCVSVLCLGDLTLNWRGDAFEPELRKAIRKWERSWGKQSTQTRKLSPRATREVCANTLTIVK